ncbi:aminodeoxychorismate lyase [Pontibacillus chungwhensis BH030062]|uniref:Aminodeoxychorismate lyase n=1 Tax=Pontibacillus chungwhensis BH030062 TaxID=1385513 RepID=A0A0A2UZJ2_9BACI|nr:endolytic transglycosylase MltG [Pontibacillus chungwhensis]KGP91966.1 aminodeoxychorismate lyase [Pontibacillus chungwhensis BH030062]
MKHTLRAFALGLLTATSLLAFAYSQQGVNEAKATDPSKAEAKALLEEKGYVVVTENKWTKLNEASSGKETNSNTQKEQAEKEATKNTASEPSNVKAYKLSIQEGMVPEDISQALAENNIIEDAEAFRQYLTENEFSRYIQIGEYTVVNQMSFLEIAKIITR